ncbi:MAG: 16S rRNA (adenine(1518)-N(6)/adenine(1519)-N(6))-dimethyltransferase RsmA [Mycobacteriales bacterium]
MSCAGLLGPAEVRALANRLGLTPRKSRGQNFVIDPNTIRRVVRLSGVRTGASVLEIGPGLGSLTLGLLEVGARVTAVEADPVLAAALAPTVAERMPSAAGRLRVQHANALGPVRLDEAPSALVANLPYNLAVPLLLHALASWASLQVALVMVQAEVAARLAAPPGSRVYGAPSVKLAYYATARRAGQVSRSVFWPVPRVDSELVACQRRDPPAGAGASEVFSVIDAAFGQRRKTLRAALAGWAGSAETAERLLRRAQIDPTARGESLSVVEFARLAAARSDARP